MLRSSEPKEEIEFSELLVVLFSNARTIVSAGAIGFFLSAWFVLALVESKYEASFRFELIEKTASFDSGSLGSFAAISGLANTIGNTESETFESRILSRKFIVSIWDESGFQNDPEFNPWLNSASLTQKLVSTLTGRERVPPNTVELQLSVLNNLKRQMKLIRGENGILELQIQHHDPIRAAFLANLIADTALEDIDDRNRTEDRKKLEYFASELLNVRAKLDASQEAVRNHAISKSLRSDEELARLSNQLVVLRKGLARIEKDRAILDDLEAFSSSGFSGRRLVQLHPVTQESSFRRLFGWRSDATQWTQPSSDAISAAIEDLTVNAGDIVADINFIEAQARSSATDALKLAKLERELQVNQAIYESMIAQFETESLLNGFESSSNRVLDRAVAPPNPVSPNLILSVGLGLILGTAIGALFVVIVKFKKGTIFTLESISRAFNVNEFFAVRHSSLIAEAKTKLNKDQMLTIQGILAEISERASCIAIASGASHKLGSKFCKSLALALSREEGSVALLDCGSKLGNQKPIVNQQEITKEFSCVEFAPNVSSIHLFAADEATLAKDLRQTIDILQLEFDKVVVLVPTASFGALALRAVLGSASDVIVLAQRKYTTYAIIDHIKRSILKSKSNDFSLVIV